MTDRNNLPVLRRAFPGTTKRTGPDRKMKGSVVTTVWGGSALQLPLSELYSIGNMEGMLSGIVINQLLQWTLHDSTNKLGLSPHRRGDVVMWSTREWDTLSREHDRYMAKLSPGGWLNFKTAIR